MPIDYSFEHTATFRDLTQTGIRLLRQPFMRSLDKLRQVRASVVDSKLVPITVKATKRLRRNS